MFKVFLIVIALFIHTVAYAYDIKAGDVLTLDRAISIALSRHPDISVAEGNVEIGKSRVGQAQSGYYPVININSGISRHSSKNEDSNFTASLNLNQNIYDFGKRENKLDIEKINLSSYERDLLYTRSQIVYAVKKAYYTALQARSALLVAQELVRQYEEHLLKARGFYDAGLKPKYEVTKAEADLANGKLTMIKAENALKITYVSLKNTIAMPDAPDFFLQEEPPKSWDISQFDGLLQRAMAMRQDMQSLLQKARAQERRISLEKTGYYPAVTGSAGYGISGDRAPFDKSWSVAVSLTMPIFSGFQTKYLVNEARASLSVVQSQVEALRQKITLEVKQAYLNVVEARQRIEAAEASVKYAGQNLELARGRYNVGIGSPIEVTDALIMYANAKNTYITAQYDYNIALAEIERVTGN